MRSTTEAARDYLAGRAVHGGGTPRDLALRLGVSRERASTILHDLGRLGHAERRSNGRWWPRPDTTDADAAACWQRFLADSARRRARRDVPTRPERVQAAVRAARRALGDGDFTALRRWLAVPWLDPISVARSVPPRWRSLLLSQLALVHADTYVQRGEPGRSLAIVDRALRSCREPLLLSELAGVRCAALRMLSPERAFEAVQVQAAGLQWSQALDMEARRHRVRHLRAAVVAPLLATGQVVAAVCEARASLDLADSGTAEWAESALCLVRALVASGDRDAARSLFGDLPDAAMLPLWVTGWIPRIEASFLARDLAPDAWNRRLLDAWRKCAGFGFQRRLIIATLPAQPQRFVADAWPDRHLASLRWAIARLHHARHGRRPSECPTCRRQPLPTVAGHALGVPVGQPERFLWT